MKSIPGYLKNRKYSRYQSITLRNGNKSSLGLERSVFEALSYLAISQGISRAELIRTIEGIPRPAEQGLASAVRCYIITTLLEAQRDRAKRITRRTS